MAALLQRLSLSHPLVAAWTVGLALRWVAAFTAVGFFGRDDYFHVLDIALAWIEDPDFVWETSDRAGAGIRSHLLPRLVQGVLLLGDSLGLTDPVPRLRFLYAVLGTYSSLLIPATWMLCTRFDPKTRVIATWLAATHFLLPYVGTRLLLEGVAMVPLTLGFAFLYRDDRTRDLVLAGVLIGLSCWLRYQVGVIGLAAACVLGLRSPRSVLWLALGAGFTVLAQGLFDLATFGAFLGPIRGNIAANLNPHEGLTRSGPFSYLLLWLVLTVPPLSIVLVPLLFQAARRQPMLSIPWLAFVVFHTLVPHKEERFMLPAMPLFIVLLAMTPAVLGEAKGKLFVWVRRYQGAWAGLFLGVNVVALAIATTAQSQANVRDAMLNLHEDTQFTGLISMGPELQTFFLDRDDVSLARVSRPDLVWLGRVFADSQRSQAGLPNRFLCFEPDCGTMELMLATLALRCEAPKVFNGFWADRIAYQLNAKHNRRRAPVYLYACTRPALALRSVTP